MKYAIIFLLTIFLVSCANKTPTKSQSAVILMKTPKLKFYDSGFISKYDNFTQIQIYSAGKTVLELKLFKDRVCKSSFECQSNKSFNKEYLSESYEDDFLKSLFDKNEENIVFRDKQNGILIKIRKTK